MSSPVTLRGATIPHSTIDMTESENNKHLAWFLGPKAENADIVEQLLLLILRDYVHWRKNYFPGDAILISKALQREQLEQHDALNQRVHELMAQLRRNFPFYSPRYLAHELSDQLIPSTLGYIAGMLFNPNNVTPEAAPVTTHLEVEACNAVITMLGYRTPPDLPPPGEDLEEYYRNAAGTEYAWAHLTSGGSIANIEALWIARQVRYLPLAIRQVAADRHLDLSVKTAKGELRQLETLTERDTLDIRPNDSIFLLGRYIDAISRSRAANGRRSADDSRLAWDLLDQTRYSLAGGVGEAFSTFPPVILVAGTAHYSVSKAADVLGIGRNNIIHIDVDEHFRLDTRHLVATLERMRRENRVVLAVIASAGTTEEGAVDPIDKIVSLRADWEREHNASFWLHVDAAWGGFMRSLLCLEPWAKAEAVAQKVSRILNIAPVAAAPKGLREWHVRFADHLRAAIGPRPNDPAASNAQSGFTISGGAFHALDTRLDKLSGMLAGERFDEYAEGLGRLSKELKTAFRPPLSDDFHLNLNDHLTYLSSYCQSRVMMPDKQMKTIQWPSRDVFSAFLAFSRADSITVDPHKMGFAPYPSGCVAFKNDRVRTFIQQRAPYITSNKFDAAIHVPPKHARRDHDDAPPRTVIESFGPYMLEGSRPGASASGLWLSSKTVPLTMHEHGAIVRGSVLAACALFEWLARWNAAMDDVGSGIDYSFIPLSSQRPDTNLVTFVVKKKSANRLHDLNQLTRAVYERFSIQSELGDLQYSYAQPFFLSRTTMEPPEYSFSQLRPFFTRANIPRTREREFTREGLVVLRATVMNPYITPMASLTNEHMIQRFVEELAASAQHHARAL
ncbi:MAG: Pyridoxal-dependent decarboxylase [Gemmatimonadetes bacterium]|nr:Pyridoxal-dependent decarboxylase [Gemmatimonadota bacterium]